ncbi:MAG: DUF6457 domain-containing protein [Actinomycetota bacterium]|nr:DUF6457 domain-containing protein [Actinomycetota bacterium]
MTDDPEQFFADLTAAIGAPALSPEEAAAVLRLAKVVADASERRFAPLTCYAAGLVIGRASEGDGDRLARLREIIDEVR